MTVLSNVKQCCHLDDSNCSAGPTTDGVVTCEVEKRTNGSTRLPACSLQLLALLLGEVRAGVKGGPLQQLPAAYAWYTQNCDQPLNLHVQCTLASGRLLLN